MNRLIVLILVTLFSSGFSVTSMAQEVPIMVKGLVWDSDSWGFAFYQALNKQKTIQKRNTETIKTETNKQTRLKTILKKYREKN